MAAKGSRKPRAPVWHWPPAQLLQEASATWGSGQVNDEPDEASWATYGEALGHVERWAMWEIGDWWNRGEKYTRRADIVRDVAWEGPSYKTCRNAGFVAGRFELSRRRDKLSFGHHAEVAGLPPKEADRLLDQAEREGKETGDLPPSRQLRQIVKREHRDIRERELAASTREASARLGSKLYSVIASDPGWRFQPWSGETGMDRAADNHYPTMSLEEICATPVPCADDAVLFLWRTAPMLEQALQVMRAWGFEYRTEFVWAKDKQGTGYWARNQHEVMMVCVRGHPPAPAPGRQYSSLQYAHVTEHSEKPAQFYEIIDDMFPSADKLEMFARGTPRAGWDAVGNEVRYAAAS